MATRTASRSKNSHFNLNSKIKLPKPQNHSKRYAFKDFNKFDSANDIQSLPLQSANREQQPIYNIENKQAESIIVQPFPQSNLVQQKLEPELKPSQIVDRELKEKAQAQRLKSYRKMLIQKDRKFVLRQMLSVYDESEDFHDDIEVKTIRFLSFMQICLQFSQICCKFERRQGRVYIKPLEKQERVQDSQQNQFKYLKDWLEWTINSSQIIRRYLQYQSNFYKLLMTRKSQNFITELQKNQEYHALLEFSQNIEDSFYRLSLDFNSLGFNLNSEFQTIFQENIMILPKTCWIIDLAIGMWYFFKEDPSSFIKKIIDKYQVKNQMMKPEFRILQMFKNKLQRIGSPLNYDSIPQLKQIQFQNLDIFYLLYLTKECDEQKKQSLSQYQLNLLQRYQNDSKHQPYLLMHFVNQNSLIDDKPKNQIIKSIWKKKNAIDYESFMNQANLKGLEKEYSKNLYFMNKLEEYVKSQQYFKALQIFTQINFDLVQKKFGIFYIQKIGKMAVSILQDFEFTCGYNSNKNTHLLQILKQISQKIRKSEQPIKNDVLFVRIEGLKSFLEIRLGIDDQPLETNISNVHNFMFGCISSKLQTIKFLAMPGSFKKTQYELNQMYTTFINRIFIDLIFSNKFLRRSVKNDLSQILKKMPRTQFINGILQMKNTRSQTSEQSISFTNSIQNYLLHKYLRLAAWDARVIDEVIMILYQ